MTPTSPFTHHFDIRSDTTYLNHGSFGITPTCVKQVRDEWTRRLEEQPMDFLCRVQTDAIHDAKQRLAEFLNTAASNLAFVDNATWAMNVIAGCFPLSTGDNVVITDHEYGAVTRVWQRTCETKATELRTATLPSYIHDVDEILDSIFSACDDNTRLIIVSHITSATAITLPIKEICERAKREGILVCVDGPHALAQLDVDLADLGCDFYTASCHKWLCAPLGSGFVYIAPEHHQWVQTPVLSWGLIPPTTPQTWDDEFVWVGTRNVAAYLSIPAAIEFMTEIGFDTFRDYTFNLSHTARKTLLQEFSGACLVADDRQWYGTMAHVQLPDGDCESLQRALWEKHQIEIPIIDWQEKRYVRVSSHLYNTSADLEQLVTALKVEL